MKLFTVTDNSFVKHSYPWIVSIRKGFHYLAPCPTCRREDVALDNELEVQLMENKGSKWPDALGCGEFPLLIVSGRFVDAWMKENLGALPLKRIAIAGELPKRLRNLPSPRYFCVDGSRIRGAELHTDASGYVGVRRCSTCEGITFDVSSTQKKQQSGKYPFAIVPQSWRGLHLFTTELTRSYFFCTEELIRLARSYRLTNLRFVRLEERARYDHEGIDYLNPDFSL